MYFSLSDFAAKLENAVSDFDEVARITETEIERIETLKIRIVDTNSRTNPEAMVRLSQQLDAYLFKLQQFSSGLPSLRFSNQILSSDTIQQLRLQALEKIRLLGQSE